MFDPQHCYDGDDCKRLYEIGLEVYRMTGDEDIALPLIKSASDHGWTDAAHFLARYWLAKTEHPEPHIWKDHIDYRNAAEFALACKDMELLQECFDNCAAGDLDDIKIRRNGHCKNYDTKSGRCVINNDTCGPVERDWCEWGNYTDMRPMRWGRKKEE